MQHAIDTRSIMLDFAQATGLSGTLPEPRRYLWTDAFAVCNFLELYRQTGESSYLQAARRLVSQVHFVLGRYSDEDSRSGWISGLGEQAGYQHPTAGGLRIGKPLLERSPEQALDERLEWDRDGQYFHYLTRWMQALTRMAAHTGEGDYQRWALELARTAHKGFTYRPVAGGPTRMYWKMSIDLSRPLVNSMGHHDPLDALVTYMELRANSAPYDISAADLDLEREIADCLAMCAGRSWATDDPLGIGGLLVDVFRLAQIKAGFKLSPTVALARLLADCEPGLQALVQSGQLEHPAQYRLAFRELGLATGLEAIGRFRMLVDRYPARFSLEEEAAAQLERLGKFRYLAGAIKDFWLQPAHQQVAAWRDHLDINRVMLVTSLAPDAYLFAGPKAAH